MGIPLRVLILEDRPADAELVVHELREAGFEVAWWRVDNEADYLAHLDLAPDVILADYSLPQWDAPHALRRLQERNLDIPFIMISGTVGEDIAVECIQQGAADYLLKDRLARLGPAVVKALADRRLRVERQRAEEEIKRLKEFNENIVQTMAEGILVQNAEGLFTFANPAAADILGCAPEELIGLPWTAVVLTEHHPIVRAADERRQRGEADRYEVDVLRKDGTRRSILLSGNPRFEDGRFEGTLAVITDITERKRAEEALRESQELLQRTFASLHDAVFIIDADTVVILDCNPAASEIFGYSREEMLGRTTTFLHVDEASLQRFREMLSSGVEENGFLFLDEFRMRRKDRTVFLTEHNVVPVENEQGQRIAWVSVVRDITERKRAEQALRKLSRAVEQSSSIIFITDPDGRLEYVNPKFTEVTGYTAEEAIGRLPRILDPDQVSREECEARWTTLRSGGEWKGEFYNRKKNGERYWELGSISSIKDENGAITHFVAVKEDITGRKQMEEALAAERNLLRTLIDNLPDLIYAKDAASQYILSNAAHARFLGVATPDEVVGKSIFDLHYTHDLATQYYADDQMVIKTGESIEHEEPSLDYAGNHGWNWITKVPLRDSHETVVGLIGIARDITERKRVEEVLRRHGAILQALASISEQLLRSTDLDAVLPEALAQLGQAAGTSRAHIFENRVAPDGTLFTNNRYEWVAPHQVSRVEALSLQNVAYAEGFERWADVLSKGQPLYGLVRELPESERAILQAQNILSQATVPIFAGEEWWGFLGFDDCEHEREWLPAEIEALRNVANALGAALVRQRAESAEQEQRTLAEALRDTAAVLTSALDLQVVMNRILENVGRVVPHDAANIMLPEEDAMRIAAHRGYTERGLGAWIENVRWSFAELAARYVFETGTPLAIPDVQTDSSWMHIPGTDWIQSFASAPIFSEGRVIGCLNLYSVTPGFFTQVHADRLQAFASQASVAIKNAQLYEAVQRHAAELEQRVIERTAELNHTTERVEAILNSSSDIIFLLSNEGIIQQANPAFGQVFNCEPETVFDQPLTILTEPDAAQTLLDALRATVESRQPQRVEIPVRYKESAVFDADMALSPTVERDHQTLGVVCSLRDITQRKELETRLRQTLEKEVELNQLKTRFVSMVSHEFRTPLAVIQTASELMLQYSDRMTEEQKRRELDHVLGGVEQMVELLDDVLVISRTEAGKLEFSPEPLDLQALCQGILAELRQTIGGAHHLEFSVTGECTDVVMDSKLLHHVIDNLLSNAIKYSPANSTVTFDLTCQWDQATLVIRDEGIGIPRADQVHLFETFHRAANVGTIPGTGLGLAIVKQAVQLHGGTITFESVEGAGTTFVVTIPNAPADEN